MTWIHTLDMKYLRNIQLNINVSTDILLVGRTSPEIFKATNEFCEKKIKNH